METNLRLCYTFILILFVQSIYAQEKTVSGIVSGEEQPIPGATVYVQGGNNTLTNIGGKYSIAVSEGDVLNFQYVGYKTHSITVGIGNTYNIILEGDNSLEEVVVVGYGTQKATDVTGAIVSIQGEELSSKPVSNVLNAAQGQIAGVQIQSSGQPGDNPTVRIRGIGTFESSAQSPLYVVDGVFYENINFLSPSNIKSINILKDASSSSIYGVRASNGVIIVEIHKGSSNQSIISYEGFAGYYVPTNVLKMANSKQYAGLARGSGNSVPLSIVNNSIDKYGTVGDALTPKANSDWYNALLQNGFTQNHNIAARGGDENSRYAINGGYYSQEGIMVSNNNKFERINFSATGDYDFNKWLKVGANALVSVEKHKKSNNGAWTEAYYAPPVFPVYDENDTEAFPIKFGDPLRSSTSNPVAVATYGDAQEDLYSTLFATYGEFTIIPEKLKFRSSINSNTSMQYYTRLEPTYKYSDKQNSVSSLNKDLVQTFNYFFDNVATYKDDFGESGVKLLGGYSYRSENRRQLLGSADGVPEELDQHKYISLGEVKNDADDEGESHYGISYFSRLEYSFASKYLLNATFRADGSSKFEEKPWGFFSSIGTGWIVSDETFLENISSIDFLKVRASWGRLGNDKVPTTNGVNTFTIDNGTSPPFGGNKTTGGIINYDASNLEWEVTEEIDAGIDARLLENRLSVVVDWYQRTTKNSVVELPTPTGNNILTNLGEISNTGIESSIGWNQQLNDDISYFVSTNITTLKNKVISLGEYDQTGGTGDISIVNKKGEAYQSFYGLEVLGVYQNFQEIADDPNVANAAIADLKPGFTKFKDQTGDGMINGDDKIILGSYLPNLTYGFSLGIEYKNFEFSSQFFGVSGNKVLNRNRAWIAKHADINADQKYVAELWRGKGTSNWYPSAEGRLSPWLSSGDRATNSFYVEDGDFFRVQSVQLAYTLDLEKHLKIFIQKAKFTLSGQNLYTFTKYSGFTPEVGGKGIDSQTYPVSAVYTFGLSLNF